MSELCHIVLLAGGRGLRLWPWSRKGRYKPFLPLIGGSTLIEATLERALALAPPDRIHIVGTADLVQDLGPFDWIVEPEARDTAPAIYYAARHIHDQDPDANILVLPADHAVRGPDQFRRGIRKTIDEVNQHPDRIWLHGTRTDLDSSYGFIVPSSHDEASEVLQFEEKPDREVALSLHDRGALRNTGIFCFRSSFLIDQFNNFVERNDTARDLEFDEIPETSIDHLLLKRDDFVDRLMVRKLDYSWSDLGTWPSLRKEFRPDLRGNVFLTDNFSESCADQIDPGEPLLIRSGENQIVDDGSRQIVCLGVDQVNVVASRDQVTISSVNDFGFDDQLHDNSNLIVFKNQDVELKVSGFDGGLVAITPDVLLIASEEELGSNGIPEAQRTLARR